MTLRKILLPALAATVLSGCIYEDVAYEQPRRVYHGGYAPRGVVVVDQAPGRYYNQRNTSPYYVNGSRGYQQVPQRGYYNRPYANQVYVDHRHHDHHGETWQERQRRELREAQRAEEKRHDDKKKKKKKKDD